jgi:hypothetical protein
VSEEQETAKPLTLRIQWTDFASKNLNARIAELRRRDQRVEMDAIVESIQFLRGVGSRASHVLPAFYTLVDSSISSKAGSDANAWKRTQAASLNFSALQTITLICRSIFDDSRNGLTGKRFANVSDVALASIAEHWSQFSTRPSPS